MVRHLPVLVLALMVAGVVPALEEARAQKSEAVTLTHVHGLAYSADGKQIMVPSHHGLAVYREGAWSIAPGPAHDYMAFAAAATRLYSSGHPAPGSGLVNPFRLIRSTDGGRTWDKLGLEGESDFHVLGVSWRKNAVYVWNPGRNSRMSSPGLYFTLNEGFRWQRAAAKGLTDQPRALALHPEDANTAVTLPPLTKDAVAHVAQNQARSSEYAIATFQRSVYITEDRGRTWRQIARNGKGL